MHSKAKGPTQAERVRWGRIQDDGCLACHLEGIGYQPPEIHHLIVGNKRAGHDQTIGLCPWHHRGIPVQGLTTAAMRLNYGPALALTPREFRNHYGPDKRLLALQNQRLGLAPR